MSDCLVPLPLSASCVWIIWHYAPQIGLSLLEDVRTVPLLRIMTLSLPFACIHACINGYYYGRKKAVIPAISQILEQVIRVAGVWLVADIQMQRGQLVTPQIAVWGILFGELASSLYSVTMVCFFQNVRKIKDSTKSIGTAFFYPADKNCKGSVLYGSSSHLQPYFVKFMSECGSTADPDQTPGFWLCKQ
ncbi:MAG: hypothetical protein ACLUD0_14635 [Eubacterium ramulus]